MNKLYTLLIFIVTLSVFSSCENAKSNVNNKPQSSVDPAFNAYWYNGKAELNHFLLQQVRYGEIRNGVADLIFVTEPFSRKKQVKLDDASQAGNDVLNVLKLNFSKKFDTGIYPYSILTSVFTPVDLNKDPVSVKISTSVQEWCGHVFTQLNLSKNNYLAGSFSYFENEGDKNESIEGALTEDGLWTTLRINPAALPLGNVLLIPSTSYLRLKHKPLKAMEAITSIGDGSFEEKTLKCYTVDYGERKLKIYYEGSFPFAIAGWEESYDEGGKMMTTRAIKNNTILLDYWAHNHNADDDLRKSYNGQ
ncbi:MAG: hypothetical protein ACOYOA_02185 [Saprospiraceae bacterium]